MEKYRFIVSLKFDDVDAEVISPIRLFVDEVLKANNCVWSSPFSLDGIATNSGAALKFYIETEHCHQVEIPSLKRIFNTGRLVYTERQIVTPRGHTRRSSIYKRELESPREINSLTLNGTIVAYTADKANDYARLIINSIVMPSPAEELEKFLGRTGTKITCNGVRATSVCTLENNTRFLTWLLVDKDEILAPDPLIEYDRDEDNSTKNSLTNLAYIVVGAGKEITLTFERTVYFPFTIDGLSPKYLEITLKYLDFSALHKRKGKKKLFTLERGLRENISLKIQYEPLEKGKEYRLIHVTLSIDSYPETVERCFKLK